MSRSDLQGEKIVQRCDHRIGRGRLRGCLVLAWAAAVAVSAGADVEKVSPEDAVKLAYDWAKYGKDPDTRKVLDTTISILSVAYPPAGAILGFASGLATAGSGSDPIGDAFRRINARLLELDQRLDRINRQVQELREFSYKQANINRLRELKDRGERVQRLLGDLSARPADQFARDSLARETTLLVNRFLDQDESEQDLWLWNDRLHVYSDPANPGALRGELLDAAFLPLPTLEYYFAALSVWMIAIENQGRSRDAIRQTYGKDLLAHARFLSVRPYWREGAEPAEINRLPERLMEPIHCGTEPVSRYPDARGECTWRSYCNDPFSNRYGFQVDSGSFPGPVERTALCTLPLPAPGAVSDAVRLAARQPGNLLYGNEALATVESWHAEPAEDEIENRWGREAMAVMADQLVRLARTGSVREPESGRFDMTYWTDNYLYEVNARGELIWYHHNVGEDRNPDGVEGDPRFEVRDRAVTPGSGAAERGASSVLGGPIRGETTQQAPAPEVRWIHRWSDPRPVGTGWDLFADVFPLWTGKVGAAQGLSMVGMTPDGWLRWYRHDGLADGSSVWVGPIVVGSGWSGFRKVFAGGDGILYAIGSDGSLSWYRLLDTASTSASPRWSGPVVVGSGWAGFVQVFSMGEGIVYAVQPDGTLLWYRHLSYQTGVDGGAVQPGYRGLGKAIKSSARWEGPKVVGSGWQSFRRIFSPGNGHIYAVDGEGNVLWYYHAGFRDGTPSWQGPTRSGLVWPDMRIAFPLMIGTPEAPAVR
ncbi:MAG: tachylectin-related carbohydrate-binding protein [Pseudomonadales bacterium]